VGIRAHKTSIEAIESIDAHGGKVGIVGTCMGHPQSDDLQQASLEFPDPDTLPASELFIKGWVTGVDS